MISRVSLLFCSKNSRVNEKRWKSTIQKIDKLLIANRGEIACRIIRTAKKLGIKTVAVYSEADKNAFHVCQADEAVEIGPPPAALSYLKGNAIIDVAKSFGCQAIHPGYGFLSENVQFAENCQKNGVIFIGPPASAIRDMGIKSTSKYIMSKAGVPIIEGYHGEDQTQEKLLSEARKMGFPVMIKAVRGGGGKGMRIALTEDSFKEALESAKTEAQKSFGDSVVLLEKFVKEPRHVEVQVFADIHGNAVHLFERDCSVQRRHQKIIEEAPAPRISNELRSELGAAAVRAAKAVGYVGAGTVEFILDKNFHSFHFMEMNTRLQVEHPITEMITGTDLVEWQIKIASGAKLPVNQNDIEINGHSFEARIYAEDPRGDFLPGAGHLQYLVTPETASDVRIETGVRQGDDVSVYYDPMIAKLVVWGENRTEALSKLSSKLQEYNIAGLETNVNFLIDLARHPEFANGNVHTNFIKDHYNTLFTDKKIDEDCIIQAAMSVVLQNKQNEMHDAIRKNQQYNPFVVENNFRINYDHSRKIELSNNNQNIKIDVIFKEKIYEVSTDGKKTWKKVTAHLEEYKNRKYLNTTIDGVKNSVNIFADENNVVVFNQDGKTQFTIDTPNFGETEKDFVTFLDKAVSPMPGVLDKVLVERGCSVKKGDSLFVLIAMKMEHVVKASRDAVIEDVLFKVGDNVAKDSTVVKFAHVD